MLQTPLDQLGSFLARTAINNGWTALAVCAAFFFARHIFHGLWTGDGWRAFYERPSNQMAIAFTLYFVGEVVARGWTSLFLRRATVSSIEARAFMEATYLWAIGGAVLSLTGALCIIRLFSPDAWRPWGWIVPGLIAVAFAAAMAFF